MIRKRFDHPEFPNFHLPFGGKLDPENRWVKLSGLIPWDRGEELYNGNLAGKGMGAPAKSGRMAFAALLVKERLGLSDEETVEQIRENPYLQYFVGLSEYSYKEPFEASMMVHFRRRLKKHLGALNEAIIENGRRRECGENRRDGTKKTNRGQDDGSPHGKQGEKEDGDGENPPENTGSKEARNKGKLIIDATCAPADITWPTDLKLLDEARRKTEKYIDVLYSRLGKQFGAKPRTYRKKARRQYLEVVKRKKPAPGKIRKAIGRQLGYLRRNLAHIDKLLDAGADLKSLRRYHYKCLLVIQELYRQQLEMHRENKHHVAHRIVSISQPHVRPIVRGKASALVELGAKISVSCIEGMVRLDRLSWENYNETADLVQPVETFKEIHGHGPESVHADKIYRTESNRKYCKERNIRLSGVPMGRIRGRTEHLTDAIKSQIRDDERIRQAIEGKFGNAKRKGSMARIMAKLAITAESVIETTLIMLNLETILRRLLLFYVLRPCEVWFGVVFRAIRALAGALRPTEVRSAMPGALELPRQSIAA